MDHHVPVYLSGYHQALRCDVAFDGTLRTDDHFLLAITVAIHCAVDPDRFCTGQITVENGSGTDDRADLARGLRGGSDSGFGFS